MEGKVDVPLETERPWQADLCQFFTRKKVAELCLEHVVFPKNLLSTRLLEPAAGQGAFFLPLLPRLVRSCRRQQKSFDVLRLIIRAYEIDARVAITLRMKQRRRSRRSGSTGQRRATSRASGFGTRIFCRPGRGRASHISWAILLIFAGMPYRALCVDPTRPDSRRSSSVPTCTLPSLSTRYHCSSSTASLVFYAPERGRVTSMAAPCAKPLRPLASLRRSSISAMRKASRCRPTPILISLYFRRAGTARPKYSPWRGPIRSGRRERPWSGHFSHRRQAPPSRGSNGTSRRS
jgi:hypothetical protein